MYSSLPELRRMEVLHLPWLAGVLTRPWHITNLQQLGRDVHRVLLCFLLQVIATGPLNFAHFQFWLSLLVEVRLALHIIIVMEHAFLKVGLVWV